MYYQQVQSGTHQSQETLCDMSSASSSPSLPFPGSSLPPIGELASQHAQSNGNRVSFQASYNSVIKIEAPEPPSDKPTCASSPAVEVAKTQDYSIAQCIPEGKMAHCQHKEGHLMDNTHSHPRQPWNACRDNCHLVEQLL